jgi:hypothetical protein
VILQSHLSGCTLIDRPIIVVRCMPPLGCRYRVGDRVVRGPDWRDRNKDGGVGSIGEVLGTSDGGCLVMVQWPKSRKPRRARYGARSRYEVVRLSGE